ncbi:MAG: hypothetical protein Q9205_000522 [Flavoplaca limonia]
MAFATTASSCSQAQRESDCRPFLSLPDVIRERIYVFVLTVHVDPATSWITPLPAIRRVQLPPLPPEPNRDLLVASKSVRKKRRRKIRQFESIENERAAIAHAAPRGCLAILATCRTILLEAFHIWYKNNTFNFARSQDIVSFLTSISGARANEIRAVRLDLSWEDWNDGKAGHALSRLRRLESLTFVYNGRPVSFISPNSIRYPRIISNLRGLQEVIIVDPAAVDSQVEGMWHWMGPCQKLRMGQLRERMTAKEKRHKPTPPMMDLFSRLSVLDQKKNDCARWRWNEDSAYAPDIARETQDVSESEA